MRTNGNISVCAGVLSALAIMAQTSLAGVLYDFSDLPVERNSHYAPKDLIGTGMEEQGFADAFGSLLGSDIYHSYNNYGGVEYGVLYNNNIYMGPSWHGFAWSSMEDATTPGVGNQYSAITGSGYGGSGNYLIFYGDGAGLGIKNYSQDALATIGISSPDADIEGIWITNTAYAYYSMLNGDSRNDKFEDGDVFKLIISGYDITGENELGTCEVYLGNGTDITDTWTYVDILADIGEDVKLLSFSFEQYDSSKGKTLKEHGCTAPTYFALGGIITSPIPEPSAYAAIFGALAFALAIKKK